MKGKDIQVGKVYAIKVSGQVQPVRLDSESTYGGWDGTNLATSRAARVKTAAKCRYELERNGDSGKWRRVGGVIGA